MKKEVTAWQEELRALQRKEGAIRTQEILNHVAGERQRQREKYGLQKWPMDRWLALIGEEFGEACRAANEIEHGDPAKRGEHWQNLFEELIQVAALCVQVAEGME